MATKPKMVIRGTAAMISGDPDYDGSEPRERATDTIANVLHAFQKQAGLTDEEAQDEVSGILGMAEEHFRAETVGGEAEEE